MKSTSSIEKLTSKILREQAESPPDTLWHYTNAAGLLGILRSGKLWATNTEYLNDASELRYARMLVWRSIGSLRAKVFDDREHDMLDLLSESISQSLKPSVFVASLSAEKNDLSQWRAYGGSSGSFALGFSSRTLSEAITRNSELPFNLYKCIYGEKRSAVLCARFVDRVLSEFRKYRRTNSLRPSDYLEIRNFVAETVESFEILAPLIKHPDFAREAEWRLVSGPVDLNKRPIHLREGRTCVVPYIEFTIAENKSEPKTTVHTQIGPAISYNPRDTTHAQIAYCDEFILQPFPVEPSQTPYRHR